MTFRKKIVLKGLSLFLLAISAFSVNFIACSKQDNQVKVVSENEIHLFSKEDLSNIKSWMQASSSLKDGQINFDNFPQMSFKATKSSSDSSTINFYMNGIRYVNDDLINGKKVDYKTIISLVNDEQNLDKNAKTYLLSVIQLSSEVLTSKEAIKFYDTARSKENVLKTRDACDCRNSYDAYIQSSIQCRAYGNYYGHCDRAWSDYQFWVRCTQKTDHCPNGFSFDGANCYSAVHFPSGYNGFIWGSGFYTQQNCSISTSNNCCPPGFGYDGANCHYWGLYFPSDYEPFIYNNCFYVKSKCY